MVSQKLGEALAQAAASPEPGPAFVAILSDIRNLSSPDTVSDDLCAVADAAFAASLGVVATRPVLAKLVSVLHELQKPEVLVRVGRHVVETVESGGGSTSSSSSSSAAAAGSSSSFVEQAVELRELVAQGYEAEEDFAAAARVLAEIPLDTSQRRVSDIEKARVWVRIVRNFLEADDSTSAETYLNKLKNVMYNVPDPELQLHFRLSAARIQDAKRQFLAAARSYHEVSLSSEVAEDERLHTLSMAIKCAVLGPAGPPRSLMLGRLYRDERSAQLPEFGLLEKMFLDRLLAPQEVAAFAGGLQPHQLAVTADGSTVLQRAVVEHNLLGASRLYDNIDFDSLGVLLGLDGDRAEATTARMIEQGRLAGRIDQIDRVIYFEQGAGDSGATTIAAAAAAGDKDKKDASASAVTAAGATLQGWPGPVGRPETRRWDANVHAVAEQVEQLANALQAEFPAFVEQQLAA